MEEDEQDRYVSQLKEVFDSCDTTGTGYLDKEELIELCQKLHLEAHLSFLLNTLLGTDHYARVNFEEFKEGFVAVLSHSLDISTSEEESSYLEPAIPEEVKPKFVKGVKRYGRKSVPDASDLDVELAMEASEPRLYKAGKSEPLVPGARRAQLKRATSLESVESLKSDEETVSNKESKQETFEAQGQMRAWACSECNGVQHDSNSQADLVGEQIRVIWEDLCGGDRGYRSRPASSMACNTICLKYLRYEEVDDLFKKLDKNRDGRVNFQEFQQELFNLSPLSTPRASTPCKPRPQRSAQQPFKEAPCRTATPPLRSPVVGLKRLSFLDDGSGCVNAEEVMSIWNEEGIQNSRTILQTLDFPVDGKLNLEELTLAFNNELLLTNNSIHQAAFLLYKKEVQFLQGQLEQSCKERDKVKADLDKAEKRSAHLAREVDDRHAAMEQIHEKKIRELEQEYREKASATKSEMDKERELLMQQVTSQSAKLEKENVCLQASDASLREQIAMATKDNGSLQKEIAELTEKLAQSEKKVSRLQKDLDHLLIEKFGNLDPHSVELFDQEERFAEIIKAYEEQCRDLRDKNDELQMELEQLRSQAQVQKSRHCSGHADGAHQDCADCRSPTDVDASEKDLANVSIEAELAVEVMKDQYQLAIQDLKIELETKVNFYERNIALLKQNIERERKDIEESFKLEISELEEQKAVLEENNAEQQRVVTALKEQLQQQASQDVGLEKRLIRERAELEQYYAKEISSLAQRLTREKEQLEAELHETRRQETEQMRVQLQLLNDENAALKSKLESLQCDIQKCEVETNKQRKQSERLKSEKDKLQQEREQLFQENTRYREEVFDISSRNLKLSSENADLSSRVESQLGAIQLLNERLGEITRQKDEEAAVARQLQESSAQLERERLQQQSAWQRERELIEEELGISREKLQRLKDCEAELSSLTIKHEWLQEDKRRLLHEIEEQKKKAEQSEKFLENVRRQVDELRSLLLVANQEKELLAQELAASQTMIEDAKNTINQLEVDVQRMQHEKRREQADDHELFELRRRCEALCSELQAARQKTEQVATSERELRQVDQECQTLRRQQSTLQSELKDTRDQLQDALTTLSLARCSHERELGELKERISASTSREEVNKVRTQLLEEQQKVKRLQESLSCQAEQAKMQMAVQQEQYEQVLRRMEEGMQDVESKLKNVREILQEKVTQLKEQLDKNARSDLLLKDLYVENSQLMKALQVTEQRQKSVEKKNFQLEEKIAALNKVLCKITPVSLTA
ncbi:ninein-like protein isoform X3 [Polypterus senegalus]|uniref:ninein-like protein isoform X3 n=1 Tax=Polypterus senegalus TaxID=55291 RepID=UPI0019636A90|nr:ninein-like protein isoform X3 [Polypterus senegalus]